MKNLRRKNRGRNLFMFAAALFLIFTSVMGFDFKSSTVKAIANANYSITFDKGNTNINNATIDCIFYDAADGTGNQIGSQMVQIGADPLQPTLTISGFPLPNGIASARVSVQTAGQQLTANSTICIGGAQQALSGDLTTNTGQTFNLDGSQAFDINLTLENPGGAGSPGAGPAGSGGGGSAVAVGNYKLTITNDEYNGTVLYRFVDASGNPIGADSAVTATVNDTPIPAGATKMQIDFSADGQTEEDRLHVKNCQAFRFDAQGTSIDEPHGIDGNNAIQYKDAIWPGIFTLDLDPATYGYNVRLEFSNKKNVQLDGADHCQLYFADANGNPEVGERDRNLVMGQDYYFLLVPDYGYQVRSLVINEWYTIEPQDATTGLFKFTMNAHNLHFAGVVKESADETDASGATSVSGVSIANASNAVDSGNLRVTVSDAPLEDVSSVVSGTVLSTVDIDLDKVISKDGTMDHVWSSDVTEFNDNVDVTLMLAGAPAGQYAVVRDHEGVKEKIDATYDPSTGALSFGSNRFSTYTIVRTDAVATKEVAVAATNGKAVAVKALTPGVAAAKCTAPEASVKELDKSIAVAASAGGATVDGMISFDLEGDVPADGNVTVSVAGFGVKPGDAVWAYHFTKDGIKGEKATVTGNDLVTLSGLTSFSPFVLVKVVPKYAAAQPATAKATTAKSPKTGDAWFDYLAVFGLMLMLGGSCVYGYSKIKK